MSTATETRTVSFEHVKETKNTHVFEEVPQKGAPPIVGRIYLQKFVVEQMGEPEAIRVTIEAA